MLWPRPLVAVRKQQRQARGLTPFRETGGDELVDDHLGAVDEVTELRLPEHERLRSLLAVAVFKAEAAELGEWAVVELETGARARQALHRADRLPSAGIVQDEVALAEGAALGVLACQADRVAFA